MPPKVQKKVYSHASEVVHTAIKDIPDAFIISVNKNKKTVLSNIKDYLKSIISKEKIPTDLKDKTKIFRKKTNSILKHTHNSIKSISKELSPNVTKLKTKVTKIIDDLPAYSSKLKTTAYKSFEEFKKYIDNSPAVKFTKTLLKTESKKVERVIKQRYIENKNNFEIYQKKFNTAKEELAEKIKDLKEALKKGDKNEISLKKSALLYAKSLLNDAKAYLEIAKTFFIKSANTAKIKADKVIM